MNKFFFSLILTIFFSTTISAKLLDKTIAIVNDKIITLSLVERVQKNLASRRNVAPMVYNKSSFTNSEIVEIFIRKEIIRSKLEEIGIVIGDDYIESEIRSIEKKNGLSREALLNFLKSNNITYDEYFELIRETKEFTIHNMRVIRPLITITDQQIKNTFFKENISDKTLSFKYTLVDFSISSSKLIKNKKANFVDVLSKFQSTGVLPKDYSELNTNVLGDITEEGLTSNLKKLLKQTDEGTFSKPIELNGDTHVFFVKKKDLVTSELFNRSKESIRARLFQEESIKMTDLWFKRQASKFYIKYYIK